MKQVLLSFILALLYTLTFANYKISGIVTEENGTLLSGTNVVLLNTNYGTFTDDNGKYSLNDIPEGEYVLQFRFVGYEIYEMKISLQKDITVNATLKPSSILTNEIIVASTRAGEKAPVAYSNINGQEIAKRNLGQDIPYLLSLSPSIVSSSDAGAGVGYTTMRIRGTSMERINVSMNGIPLNDSESHGVWWVNMPDLSSSVSDIQIQRGVGTSTNGAAAFGASVNFNTLQVNKKAYAEISSAYGSFNTFKNTVKAGTGLLHDHFSVDARLSKITSDGFIDRAESDLKSFSLSGTYYSENTIIRANIISGKEKTYQAWNGVPKAKLDGDKEGIEDFIANNPLNEEQAENLRNSDARTYNIYTYDNETDNYQQDHYHFLMSHVVNPNFNLNFGLHYTYGRGYYEQFKDDEKLKEYKLDSVFIGDSKIGKTDLIRQKWLDNNFYGGTFSANLKTGSLDCSFGGAWNKYEGDHFGEVIWAQYASNGKIRHRWYENDGIKTDFNIYTKFNIELDYNINLFADLQFRKINYEIDGVNDDLRKLNQKHDYDFFNPKFGVFWKISDMQSVYTSFAIAHREPTRTNFIDAYPENLVPKSESLRDLEFGYKFNSSKASFNLNVYYMNYKDQLIHTGAINDVGSPIMTNVDKSYRTGLELTAGFKVFENLKIDANLTVSKNKIDKFTEYIDNWEHSDKIEGSQPQFSEEHEDTDLPFSPNIVSNANIEYKPLKGIVINFISKYVGDQYIDNTSNSERKLDAYWINDLVFSYTTSCKATERVTFKFMINNVFDAEYETNAWVYRFSYGGETGKLDGYFPQAGINFMGGIDILF